MSLVRIGAPQGRNESKVQQPTVKIYSFQDSGVTFTALGHDTLQEEHMLRVAWDFYRKGVDYGANNIARSRTNHFEMFARFFVADQIGRKLAGLYSFLCDSSTILAQKGLFWPRGHPNDPNTDLRQCTFNVDMLAENVRWYVDFETRFWNTLEFRIGDTNAIFASALLNDYCAWLESQGLGPGTGYLRETASAFDQAASDTGHPFFALNGKAGRLNPSLWQNGAASSSAVVSARSSPQKRKPPPNSPRSTPGANAMLVDVSNQDAEEKLLEEIKKNTRMSPVTALVDIASVPSPSADQSMQVVQLSGNSKTVIRTMLVPQYGDNVGQAPKLADVYTNTISIRSERQGENPMSLKPPPGLSNTGDNLLSIVYNSNDDGKTTTKNTQVILIMLQINGNIPTLLVRDHRFVNNKRTQTDSRILLVSARPSDCCVSWDGLRVVVNDTRTDRSHWIYTVDLVPDDKTPTMLTPRQTTTSSQQPVMACTRFVNATYNELHTGDPKAPTTINIKAPPDQDLKLVSVSTNAWMQSNPFMILLQDAYRHSVFVHLYERKDGTYLAVVTPLSEDGTQAESDKTFSMRLQLPRGVSPKANDDKMVPRVLWYPLSSYALDVQDQLSQHKIDETKDQALVIWCVHQKLTIVTTAPAPDQNPDDYVPAVTLIAKYTPMPILNNLSLKVLDDDFTPTNILDFHAAADVLAP